MAYDLVAIAGPIKGTRFQLSKDKETVIGRTQRGVNLPDPQVSVRHCRVVFENGDYALEDLDSATGTTLNGASVTDPVVLQLGDVIRVGESELRVDSRIAQTIRWVSWAMLPAWLMVLVAVGAMVWAGGEFPTVVKLKEPINTGVGGRTDELVIPKAFIRAHGFDVADHALRRITDFNKDGLDELWLQKGDDEFVVTFDGPNLVVIGRFPSGCVDRPSTDFPDLRCRGIEYRMMGEAYAAVAQKAPVVWMTGPVPGKWTSGDAPLEDPKKKKKGEEEENAESAALPPGVHLDAEATHLNQTNQPVPLRVALASPDQLAGFLAARGVTQPVQYVICENGIPGLEAQAVLESGEVRSLLYGCDRAIKLEGTRAEAFEGAKFVAIAFSEAGRLALTKHLTTLWTGAPEPAFLDGDNARKIQSMRRWPFEVHGGLHLAFAAPDHVFDPLPSAISIPERVALVSQNPPVQPATTVTLTETGTATIDVPGCASAEVDVGNFRCALMRGCLPGSTFLEVRQTGCGAKSLLAVGYEPGLFRAESAELDVRVVLDTASGLAVTDALRARVEVRPKTAAP